MFKQSWKIDFGPENGLPWRAEVTLWAQDEEKIRQVLYGRRTIKKMINKETNVWYAPFSHSFVSTSCGISAWNKTVEVDEPELAKVMEEQMERHLFGEEHDPKARTLRCNLCGGGSYV